MARFPPTSPERLKQLRSMIEDGASISEIRRTLHMDKKTVRKYSEYPGWTKSEGGKLSMMLKRMNGGGF